MPENNNNNILTTVTDQKQSKSSTNMDNTQQQQKLPHTSFTHPASGEMALSARGAIERQKIANYSELSIFWKTNFWSFFIQLEKDFHDSVDELLKLCSDVTDEATTQLAMQAKALSNDKSDPVKEDMFKRRLEHMNQDTTRKQHNSGSHLNQEYNFDELHRVQNNNNNNQNNNTICHYLHEKDKDNNLLILSTWV